MAMLEPRLAILDETDSGLDIDALKTVAQGVNATRNPELWIGPFSASGAIAGRLTNLYGQSVGSVKVQFQRQDSFYVTESYVDSGTPGDTQWQETFAISDLQSGYYTVFIKSKDGATLYRNTALVVTGQVTWLGDIHIAQP